MSIGKVMARHWGEAGGMGRPVVSQDTVSDPGITCKTKRTAGAPLDQRKILKICNFAERDILGWHSEECRECRQSRTKYQLTECFSVVLSNV